MNAITIRMPESVGHVRRLLPLLKNGLNILKLYRQRYKQRQLLATLDARLLKDIGLTRSDVMMEADKPFWKP
jgi:uncharacterized protein YjiS (DUF1127 family)